MTQERIGLFGGSFDPIHLGHLILAHDALEILNLDRLIFLPARISPYKIEVPPAASCEDRLAMLHLAVEGESRFSVDPRELKREGPSYAIETVRELQEEFPHASFIYLIGEDHVATLDSWKESQELQKRVVFAVLTRPSHAPSLNLFSNSTPATNSSVTAVLASSSTSCTLGISAPEISSPSSASASLERSLFSVLPRRLDISSTEIRKRLAKGDSVRYFLPTAVFHYLEKKSLYRSYV